MRVNHIRTVAFAGKSRSRCDMADFEFDEDTPIPRRRRESGHGGSSFWTMFGGSMGCVAAVGVILFSALAVCLLMCGGCVTLGVIGKGAATNSGTQRAR